MDTEQKAKAVLLAEMPRIVGAAARGEYGPSRIRLPCRIREPLLERVVLTDPSPASDGKNHVESVEAQLNP